MFMLLRSITLHYNAYLTCQTSSQFSDTIMLPIRNQSNLWHDW